MRTHDEIRTYVAAIIANFSRKGPVEEVYINPVEMEILDPRSPRERLAKHFMLDGTFVTAHADIAEGNVEVRIVFRTSFELGEEDESVGNV